FNTAVTAAGGYGPVTVTSSVGVNVANSVSHAEQVSRNTSIAVTRKASARSRQEHKVSFRVTSSSGAEDQSVRRIRNPFPDRATRVDYYQLIRRWKVNLHRYGVRLTYDLVIPEPGSDLLDRLLEIEALKQQLDLGFNAQGATGDAAFALDPTDIDADS